MGQYGVVTSDLKDHDKTLLLKIQFQVRFYRIQNLIKKFGQVIGTLKLLQLAYKKFEKRNNKKNNQVNARPTK